MVGSVSRAINSALGRVFSERRIFVRTDSKTRYIHLTPLTQLGLTAVTVSMLSWSGYATYGYVNSAVAMQRVEMQLDAIRHAHDVRGSATLAAEQALAAAQERADEAVADIAEKLGHQQAKLVEKTTKLAEAEVEGAALRARVDVLMAAKRKSETRVAELERAMLEASAEFASARPLLGPRIENLGVVSVAMDRVIAERDEAVEKAENLDVQLRSTEAQLATLEDRQEHVLSRLEEAARTSLSGMTKMFERANIDLDQILASSRRDYGGAGGPFEPIAAEDLTADDAEDMRIAGLMQNLETIDLLRHSARKLPFAHPVTGARLTSGFGKRSDPIHKRWSMHNGIDFAGRRGTPISSTAEGVVTHAGRMSGYGLIVIIQHAFGFETRYAHLSRVRVKVGQRVNRGDRIGDMGNTGRSTGTHLHYEVRKDKKPINPAKFIEAAHDVL